MSLDTNVAVDLMRGRLRDVRQRFERARVTVDQIVVSSVVVYELAHGVRRSARPQVQSKVLEQLLDDLTLVDFDAADALAAAALRHELETPGSVIGTVDMLIAGQALARGWTLVTNDVGHFGRVQNLPLIDWRLSDAPLTYMDILARLSSGE